MANVSPPGASNEYHCHPGAVWSAVYYVDDGQWRFAKCRLRRRTGLPGRANADDSHVAAGPAVQVCGRSDSRRQACPSPRSQAIPSCFRPWLLTALEHCGSWRAHHRWRNVRLSAKLTIPRSITVARREDIRLRHHEKLAPCSAARLSAAALPACRSGARPVPVLRLLRAKLTGVARALMVAIPTGLQKGVWLFRGCQGREPVGRAAVESGTRQRKVQARRASQIYVGLARRHSLPRSFLRPSASSRRAAHDPCRRNLRREVP